MKTDFEHATDFFSCVLCIVPQFSHSDALIPWACDGIADFNNHFILFNEYEYVCMVRAAIQHSFISIYC